MAEIRFRTDDQLENKCTYLIEKLGLNSKRALFEYLVNKQYEKMMEAQQKNVN